MDENKKDELNKALEGIWESLTDEQKAKARECKSMDELAVLAASAGVELPDEMLDAVAGGGNTYYVTERAYCYYCHHPHFLRKTGVDFIRPVGDQDLIRMVVYRCGEKNKNFYVSEERNQVYRETGEYLGNWTGLGC